MFRNKNTLFKIACIVVYLMVGTPVSHADDVTDSISEGLKQYKDGEFTEAASSLTYAAQLINQKKSGNLISLFPEPLSGWTAEDASSDSSGAAFGVGLSAERHYQKGSSSVAVEIVADSPMMQGVLMMLTNPMIAQSDGGKFKKIAGQKAVVKYNSADKTGEILIVVANRFMVTINGEGVTSDDLINYAGAVDYKKMAELP